MSVSIKAFYCEGRVNRVAGEYRSGWEKKCKEERDKGSFRVGGWVDSVYDLSLAFVSS